MNKFSSAVEELDGWYVSDTGVHLSEEAKEHLREVLRSAYENLGIDVREAVKALISFCTCLDNASDVLQADSYTMKVLIRYSGSYEDETDYLECVYKDCGNDEMRVAGGQPDWNDFKSYLEDEGYVFAVSSDETRTYVFTP